MKKVSQLILNDFMSNPIWTWADDDEEDLVCPLEGEISDVDAVFVLSDFWFINDQHASGFIAVRTSDNQVYIAAIADDLGSFIDLPLNPNLKDLANIQRLEEMFDVSVDKIFPIRYSTKDYSGLSRQYSGKIENIY